MSRNNSGFTLIELLIVLGMLAAVMTAVYAVYEVHQKSAYTQDEVVEVQQNLRIAMDEISKDIRNAGMLLPFLQAPYTLADTTAIRNFGNGTGVSATDSLTLNTASASGRYAMIANDYNTTGATDFVVVSREAIDKFANTDNRVRIIRPRDKSEPSPGVFTLTGFNRLGTTMTVGVPAGVTIEAGDVIVGTTAGARPETIQYCLGPGAGCPVTTTQCPTESRNCLARIENGTLSVIASNVTDLQFAYIMADLSETPTPGTLSLVRAVRVTLRGRTIRTGSRERQLTSVVNMRNSF